MLWTWQHGDVGLTGAVRAGATSVVLRDAAGEAVADAAGPDGVPTVPAATLVPRRPVPVPARCHARCDEYSLPVGIRAVRVDGARLLLNGEPVRLRGFGMHEDTALCGKGHDDARMIRGFALLKWIGANSFRTARTIKPEASSIMSSFAHGLIADRSAGLIAVAVQKASER